MQSSLNINHDKKEKNNNRINCCRVIKKFEVNCNLILKLIWPKKATQLAKQQQKLLEKQCGGHPQCSVNKKALINDGITEINISHMEIQ